MVVVNGKEGRGGRVSKSGDRTIDGSTATAGDFAFGTLAILLTLLCQCLSDETLKAVGPFYLVSMPGEVKDPTMQSALECVTVVDSTSHSKNPPVCEYAALDAALHSIRRRRKKSSWREVTICQTKSNAFIQLFADDANMFKTVENDEDQQDLAKDLGNLECWARLWLMRFIVGKCKVLTSTP